MRLWFSVSCGGGSAAAMTRRGCSGPAGCGLLQEERRVPAGPNSKERACPVRMRELLLRRVGGARRERMRGTVREHRGV